MRMKDPEKEPLQKRARGEILEALEIETKSRIHCLYTGSRAVDVDSKTYT